jgi:RNA-directed DNA polymerase
LLRQRIADPQMLALIGRFLKAGVMIGGRREDTDAGVPQGSVLSPLLANVYLHYVLDEWFEHEVKPRLLGEAYIVRYADDFICAFELESDAIASVGAKGRRGRSISLVLPITAVRAARNGSS